MGARLNYGGLVIAGLGFFLTRFTVALALYEEPVRFLLSGVVPLTLGLGLAAFGVALAVADVERSTVRTVAAWAVIGAVTMFVLSLLTLLGSGSGEMPAFATLRSRAYFSNFLIGGSVGGTLTGLYAARNRRQRGELERQANRLEMLNRLLRHEVLNALTVIRGYASETAADDPGAGRIIRQRADDIKETIEEVKHLSRSARRVAVTDASVDLDDQLRRSIDDTERRYPGIEITMDRPEATVAVTADDRLELLFARLLEWLAAQVPDESPRIEVRVRARETDAVVGLRVDGEWLTERERALLETGEIPKYDDPSSGFGLNIARLLAERYHGSIATAVGNGETAITVTLPRRDSGAPDRPARPGNLSGFRPAVPHLLVILGAGMIAGVLWGIGSELFGGSVAFIGVFYGTASPLVGWITHQFHSGVFAFVFAGILTFLPEPYQDRLSAYVAVGLAWGLVLWFGAAGIIAPLWLRLLGIPASIPNLTGFLFVAHVLWGISLGALTSVGYRRVVPWLRARSRSTPG